MEAKRHDLVCGQIEKASGFSFAAAESAQPWLQVGDGQSLSAGPRHLLEAIVLEERIGSVDWERPSTLFDQWPLIAEGGCSVNQ